VCFGDFPNETEAALHSGHDRHPILISGATTAAVALIIVSRYPEMG
jgi:hypothetical protein